MDKWNSIDAALGVLNEMAARTTAPMQCRNSLQFASLPATDAGNHVIRQKSLRMILTNARRYGKHVVSAGRITIGSVLLIPVLSFGAAHEMRPRELFYTPVPAANASGPTPPMKESPDKPRTPQPQITAAHSGLKVTLARQMNNGEWSWAPLTWMFHSGDRIRLHIESNVNGRLTILQTQHGGAAGVLFPSKTSEQGRDRIKGGEKTVLGFKFDDNPGIIRLLVFLRPEDVEERGTADEDTPMFLASRAERVLRGRGLRIEEDNTDVQPAKYVVRPKSADDPDHTVAVEITLRHGYR